MKSKTMMLMAVAVVCGLVASYLTSRVLSQQKDAAPEKKMVAVWVAKQKLALGTLLKEPEKLFVEKEYLEGTEPKAAIRDIKELKGQRLNKPLNADVHITKDDISKDNIGLQPLIPNGYRAFAIKVSSDTNVAGFTLPDARVDVISTTTRGGDKAAISKIILQNVRVLGVDTKVDRGESQSIQANTVTLQVKPDEAERLAMAGSMGELKLVLRGYGDEEMTNTRGARPGDVARSSTGGGPSGSDDEDGANGAGGVSPAIPDAPKPEPRGPVVEKKPEPPPPPKTHTLTIINGSQPPVRTVFVLGDGQTETTSRTDSPPAPAAPRVDNEAKEEAPAPKVNPVRPEPPANGAN